MNIRQIKAIQKANKERILKVNPNVPETSGIYFLLREEGGFKFAYVGQAKHLLSRLADHLGGYQHIDISIKKHGLYSADNPTGWTVNYLDFPEDMLDEKEQFYIKLYAGRGYQMRNHTTGSQGAGKASLGDACQPRTYQEGVAYGYLKARREVARLFRLHLNYSQKSEKPNKNQEKARKKFEDFINCDEE